MNRHFLILVLISSFLLSSKHTLAQISGPSYPKVGVWYDYTFTGIFIDGLPQNLYWYVTNGYAGRPSNGGKTVKVKFTSAGPGTIIVKQGNLATKITVGTKNVTAGVKPGTPPSLYVQSYNCSSQTVSRSGSPPSGTKWYWQTSSGGTSKSNYSSSKSSTGGWVYLRAKNNYGWSTSSSSTNVQINSSVPPKPVTTSAQRCLTSNMTLNSNNASDEWYTTSTGGTKFFTGNSYTASFSSSKTYYVEAVTSFGCRSTSRTVVTATVHPQTVGGTLSGSTTFCASGTASLSLSGKVGIIKSWQVRSKQGTGSWSSWSTFSTSTSTSRTYSTSNSKSTNKYYQFRAFRVFV